MCRSLFVLNQLYCFATEPKFSRFSGPKFSSRKKRTASDGTVSVAVNGQPVDKERERERERERKKVKQDRQAN